MEDSTFISNSLAITPQRGVDLPDGGDSGKDSAAAKGEEVESDSEMWNMYFDEVKEEDNGTTDAWKEDANSIVVFTGLFSAIVGAFIIEFYKKLSSDSGAQTVALLQQISQQLPNSLTSTISNTANQPSSPGIAMVWINAMWLISLVLSLTCALIATLLQQWARRYIETPKTAKALRHRARVRSLLIIGTKLYKIPFIVEMLPTLLHLSVYLFLAGLVIAFHTIDKKVAIAVDVAVGASGVTYLMLSILPCLDVRCPYRTPISKIVWYPCHAFLSFAALFLHRCILGLHGLLNRQVLSRRQVVLQRWLKSRGFSVKNHWKFLTDGLENSIVYRAVKTPKDGDPRVGDRRRFTWLFNQLALRDKQTFVKFAASVPIHKIPDLIPPIDSVPFRESLLVLLRNRIADGPLGFGGTPLDSGVATRSFLVCLHAIRHIVKTEAPTIDDLDFMRDHFADTNLMRIWGNDFNTPIRIISRSICALVARQVVRNGRLDTADLHWLQKVTESSSDTIPETDVTVLDQMNFKSFVLGALSNPVLGDPRLSTEDARYFNETLAILLGMRNIGRNYFATRDWESRLSEEVGRIQQRDPVGGREVFNRLLLIFPSLSPAPTVHAVPSPREIPPSRTDSPLYHRSSPYSTVPPLRDIPPSRAASPYRATSRHHIFSGVRFPREIPFPAQPPYHTVPPPRAASPHRAVPPPHASRPPRAVPPRAVTPPGDRVTPLSHPIPSPHVNFLPGPIPSPRVTPHPTPHVPPPRSVAHPSRATRPSRRARSPHAPM